MNTRILSKKLQMRYLTVKYQIRGKYALLVILRYLTLRLDLCLSKMFLKHTKTRRVQIAKMKISALTSPFCSVRLEARFLFHSSHLSVCLPQMNES
jgi:hypothetical protein